MTENTLRDQFAMAALTGLLANGEKAYAAREAYEQADMMLAWRQNPVWKPNEGAEK